LIVFVLRESRSVPASLVNWLETWSGRRQVPEAALALWEGANDDAFPARATGDLSQFADRHGLSFIFDVGKPVDDIAAMSARDPHERELALTPTIPSILDQPVFSHQCWAANG
jgi:hypothetical protein